MDGGSVSKISMTVQRQACRLMGGYCMCVEGGAVPPNVPPRITLKVLFLLA